MKEGISGWLPRSLVTCLTVTFVVLKALGHLDWSWLWVFSPVWITLGALVAFLALGGLMALIVWWLNEPWRR